MIFVFVILLFISQSILNAQIQYESLEFDGRTRNYILYLPKNYTGNTNFPLVIYLHSYGATAQQEMNYTQLNQVADVSDFIVVYPSGVPNWNSDVVNIPRFPNPDVDDVGFINALIDILSNNYNIDLERIYACGFSNGGAMAFRLAFQLSDRIAAIASVGGPLSPSVAESYKPVRPIPVLYIHGTNDLIVPINGDSDFPSAEQTISIWTSFNDCVHTETTILPDLNQTDSSTVEKIIYTDCSENCDVVYYKVINGGHTWPGGQSGYESGTTNQDINASVEIWNFFNRLFVPPVVDFNGDGIVDAADMCIMVDHWGENYSYCDIGPRPWGDGIIDTRDLIVLSEYLFEDMNDPTLLAHWAFDETEGMAVADSAGDNNGYAIGDPVWQPNAGLVDGALQLDGVDDYVVTGTPTNPADGPFSILVWVKGGAPGQVIISQQGAANWLMTDAEGNLMTELKERGRAGKPLISQSNITDGNWHRITFVWDGSRRTLYVDNVAVAQDTQNNLEYSVSGLYLGCGKGMEAGTFFSGLIDDVRIYNRVVRP